MYPYQKCTLIFLLFISKVFLIKKAPTKTSETFFTVDGIYVKNLGDKLMRIER
jgi:hypothetical protein